MDETRLRERVVTGYDHIVNERLDELMEMWSEREQGRVLKSEKGKEQVFEQWKTFLSREKPTFELVSVKIDECRATAEMQGSVLLGDGNKSLSTYYDLWVFENGDWFLDDALRTSPEFFSKD